jgi:TetR/AcrR family transcriptional repressor of nem operon
LFQDGIKAYLQVLDELLGVPDGSQASGKAMAILSLMVGAVTLSRVLDDGLSQGVLEAAADEVRRIAGSPAGE